MMNFAAIDFETANGEMSSVCSVGIVVVKGGQIVDRFYSLIHPTPNYYISRCQNIHGLNRSDTNEAPTFPIVWKEVEAKIAGLPLVAHNAAADESSLKAAFLHYNMTYPNYSFYCTYKASLQYFPDLPNHQLQTVASFCGFDLKLHHQALADAEACAAIALKIL